MGRMVFLLHIITTIESSKLACDTGGHCTNYPTWPLPRTNPNVDVLNNSLNYYYALANLMLYYAMMLVCKHKAYNSMFTDVLAVTPYIIKRPDFITVALRAYFVL